MELDIDNVNEVSRPQGRPMALVWDGFKLTQKCRTVAVPFFNTFFLKDIYLSESCLARVIIKILTESANETDTHSALVCGPLWMPF